MATSLKAMSIRTLAVAAVQMRCEPCQIEHNLAHAGTMVENAAQLGAQLVLLPELVPGGYLLTEDIWDTAEAAGGRSVTWLKDTAKRLGIYLGMSYLEAEDRDFYNSFVLATPKGKIAGRVRKNPPASVEAYFYTAGADQHVIHTDIGRIGVGICYENLLHERICGLLDASVDLLLQPMSAGRPNSLLPGDAERFDQMLREGPAHHAKVLGVPVLMANKSGPLETDMPGWLPRLKSSFPGLSAIVDSDGSVRASLGDEEGVIVADVTLDPERKRQERPKCHGARWSLPVLPWYAFLWPLTQRMGEKAYAANARRVASAKTAATRRR